MGTVSSVQRRWPATVCCHRVIRRAAGWLILKDSLTHSGRERHEAPVAGPPHLLWPAFSTYRVASFRKDFLYAPHSLNGLKDKFSLLSPEHTFLPEQEGSQHIPLVTPHIILMQTPAHSKNTS